MDTQRRLGDLEVAFNRIITLDAGSHRVASASPPEEAAQRQSVDDEDGGVPMEEPVQDAWEKPVLVHDVAPRKDTKDVVDGTNFKVGEPVDERLALCPWHNVQSYPNCFVGKANKTDNFSPPSFYFYDPAKVDERPYLFVPTAQFEDYLDDINARLDIRLSLPNRANLERFILRFDRGMPRPRYWKRAVETEDIRPDGPWPGVYAADIDVFNSATLPARDELVRKLRCARTSPFIEEKRRKAKERSEQKRVERGQMLHQTQVLFGLRGEDGEEQEKVWDTNGSKAIERPVFVCFDIEAFERPPNPVSEVGIAVFDSQLVNEVPHGTCGRDWWPVIKAHHLRIREYSGLVNRVFVKGCPGDFNFG
ncbi:good for full dbp5 protein 2 [Geosmithia morbida]|uniref:Good for full dbp5 protein 2 n=1 Tax=Geosmithia morbida TaxID=1094350 RepID=A0A9P4YRE8_9HYPO|nr:good for full dbp5 protein 2 [Geosmithia morbida]KAF4121182.1 good for full dbp5 protein 2 [Geosmithia morbida]